MAGRRSKAPLLVIFVTVFIDLLGFGIVLPLLPRYAVHFQASTLDLALLMSSFSAMQFLFAPAWGRLSDRIGRRPVLIVGLAGSTFFYALFGYASSLGSDGTLFGMHALHWLLLTRVGQGIAGATIPTAQAYIADSTAPEARGKGMALIGAAFGIGFTFGPLIGAPFVPDAQTIAPSSAPGYVASVLSGMAMLSAIFLLPESLKPDSAARGHRWFDVESFRTALARPSIALILGCTFLTTFAFAQFESTLSLLTNELGLSEKDNYYVFAYIGFVLAVSQGVLVRRLIPKLGEFVMALAGTGLMTLGLGLVGVVGATGSILGLCLVLPIVTVGFSALTPSLQSLLSLRSAETHQGGILGLGQSVSAMARILGPALGMTLFNAFDLTMPYYVAAALMLVGLAMVAKLKPRGETHAKRDHETDAATEPPGTTP